MAPLSTGQLLIECSVIYIYLELEFGSLGTVNVARPTKTAKPVITLQAILTRYV